MQKILRKCSFINFNVKKCFENMNFHIKIKISKITTPKICHKNAKFQKIIFINRKFSASQMKCVLLGSKKWENKIITKLREQEANKQTNKQIIPSTVSFKARSTLRPNIFVCI